MVELAAALVAHSEAQELITVGATASALALERMFDAIERQVETDVFRIEFDAFCQAEASVAVAVGHGLLSSDIKGMAARRQRGLSDAPAWQLPGDDVVHVTSVVRAGKRARRRARGRGKGA